MKKMLIALCILSVCLLTPPAKAEELSRERQLEIVQAYMAVTPWIDYHLSVPLQEDLQPLDIQSTKCGTKAVLDYYRYKEWFDPDLAALDNQTVQPRPTYLELSILSPSGKFRIHYTDLEGLAPWDGVDGYVDSVARIFDECYAHEITLLGYPAPPEDGFYPTGGDAAYDVYLKDLDGLYFGLAYPDSLFIDGVGTSRATGFIVIDNDYQEIPYYAGRPLDAVRITAAHEFFHVVQFGIDFTEFTGYWMEMSATWMEEEVYDDINDYYFYLPFFFNCPWASIQQFASGDIHPYASMLYPLFLSERYGRDLIRDIWLWCADLGILTDDFLMAADIAIGDFTGAEASYTQTFQEFALWNYYTGSRAVLAPDGIGYEEGAAYSEFDDDPGDSVIAIHNDYPDTIRVLGEDNIFSPFANAAFYLQLDEIQPLDVDTTYWRCNEGSFPNCMDSSQVFDLSGGYDMLLVDSVLQIGLDLDNGFPSSWGLGIIKRLEDYPDSTVIDQVVLPEGFNDDIEIAHSALEGFVSVTLVLTPAIPHPSAYSYPSGWYDVGYKVFNDTATYVAEELQPSALPEAYQLKQNYPNPFNPSTAIEYSVSRRTHVSLTVYDVLGRKVMTLVDAVQPAGDYRVSVDATGFSSGLYLYRLKTGEGFSESRKMLLLR